MPALRERRDDIPLLVNFFLSRFAKSLGKDVRGVSQRSMDSLIRYAWPGNIRELQNVIERAVVLAKGAVVPVDDSMLSAAEPTGASSSIDTLENNERRHILRALHETRWVIHGRKAPRRFSASIRALSGHGWKNWRSKSRLRKRQWTQEANRRTAFAGSIR